MLFECENEIVLKWIRWHRVAGPPGKAVNEIPRIPEVYRFLDNDPRIHYNEMNKGLINFRAACIAQVVLTRGLGEGNVM